MAALIQAFDPRTFSTITHLSKGLSAPWGCAAFALKILATNQAMIWMHSGISSMNEKVFKPSQPTTRMETARTLAITAIFAAAIGLAANRLHSATSRPLVQAIAIGLWNGASFFTTQELIPYILSSSTSQSVEDPKEPPLFGPVVFLATLWTTKTAFGYPENPWKATLAQNIVFSAITGIASRILLYARGSP